MTRLVPRAAALAAAATLAACAPLAEAPPPGPPPFRGVKRLVLVRRVDDPRAQRGRDPLDALKESLVARGYEARIVELGAGKDASLKDVDALEGRVEARMWSRERTTGRPEALGADAGAIVSKLGADAVVGYHRLRDQLPPLLPPPTPWGAPPPVPQQVPARRPAGALSLVAASGAAAWFPWGGQGPNLEDPAVLINPAEAIDAVLAALAGRTGDEDDGG